MKYTTLLFDNDDTIMDFGDAERQGIKRTFEQNGLPYDEEILNHYSSINLSFWKRFERGEIEKSAIYEGRFIHFSKETGLMFDTKKIAQDYIINLSYGHKCVDGAKELLKNLYGKYSLYIVTNGEKKTQDKRISESGLLEFFDGVFVSETTGYQKPDKRYFDYVFDNIPEKRKEKILIIGDSLSSDIKGGMNVGIDTCWYNPRRATTELKPTYEIHSLDELYSCIE